MEYVALGLSILALFIVLFGNLYLTYKKNKALEFYANCKTNGIHGRGQGLVIPNDSPFKK
ncbi:TPA: hypothetical protein ACN311_004829 [Vibrio parahaemolyticus]